MKQIFKFLGPLIVLILSSHGIQAQNWQMYDSILTDAQIFDSQTEWLDSAGLYWSDSSLLSLPKLNKINLQGFNQTIVLDHHQSESNQSLYGKISRQLINDGFSIAYTCVDEECGSSEFWYDNYSTMNRWFSVPSKVNVE